MNIQLMSGDLLDQDVDVIVNAWNRNIIPWWLLLPQGVSGAIKRRGGIGPFKELARHGSMLLGATIEYAEMLDGLLETTFFWSPKTCSPRK